MNEREFARWVRLVEIDPDGCWTWVGCTTDDGYGRFKLGNSAVGAHRVSYQHFVGPIPEGLQLDHLCRNRCCVNPTHLEPVTVRENVLRGNGPGGINARKTHCPSGHPLEGENLEMGRNGDRAVRRCRTCRREQGRQSWRRRKAAA